VAAIIGEPSNWDRITLGYKGSLVVQYVLEQETAHFSGPNQSAAEKAVDFWLRAKEYAEQQSGGQPRSFQTLDVTLRAISSSSDGLRERAEATVAYRVPLGRSMAELKAQFEAWREAGELTFWNEEEPFQAPRNTALVRAFLQAIRDEGGDPRFALKHGTSDMNIVGPMWGCQIVAYGPGDSRLDHTPQEHISLAEYRKGIQVLVRVLRSL